MLHLYPKFWFVRSKNSFYLIAQMHQKLERKHYYGPGLYLAFTVLFLPNDSLPGLLNCHHFRSKLVASKFFPKYVHQMHDKVTFN